MTEHWDCVIAGGGAAGLSAALVLGRARRRTLVVDAGEQSNNAAHGIGGLLGYDGRAPADLYEAGRAELAGYPSVDFRRGEIISAREGFTVELDDGTTETARTVLLATGMDYRPPAIRGLSELWGNSAFHCPFCHGWEVRDQPLAVLANGDRAEHLALLLRGWSDDIIVLTDGPAELTADQRRSMATAGVGIDERPVTELTSQNGQLDGVIFADGQRLARAGILVATTLHQRSTLADQLGVATVASRIAVDAVVVDAFARTSVPGVFAAGDICAQMPQVAAAVAAGSLAGASIMQYLMSQDVGLPTPPWPAQDKETEYAHA